MGFNSAFKVLIGVLKFETINNRKVVSIVRMQNVIYFEGYLTKLLVLCVLV